MSKLINLVGKKFGNLIVTARDLTSKKRTKWLCNCTCGNITSALSDNLRNDLHTSCGCSKKIGANHPSWKGYGDISAHKWSHLVRSAKNRQIEITIKIEYAWNLFIKQNKKCALTGLDLKFQSSATNYDGNASLDRVDSTKGYIVGNVQWVHKDVQFMKYTLTQERLFELANLITNRKVG